jgi:hypothetical protein
VVDELDRCRPTYAIEFLEVLKHLFNIKGLAGLHVEDWKQLSCPARALFGGDLDTEEYFCKFVSRKVPLPSLGVLELKVLTQKLWHWLFLSEVFYPCKRFTCAPRRDELRDIPVAILYGLGIRKPRQIEEIFRVLAHYCLIERQNGDGSQFIEIYIINFLLDIQMDSSELFDEL